MRIAAHHRSDDVVFRQAGNLVAVEPGLFELMGEPFDRVYASLIFTGTWRVAERVKQIYPQAIIGGTGWSVGLTLDDVGITNSTLDYSIYPRFKNSIGFTQRGCRLRCKFCVVPEKEGAVREENTIAEIWRGEGNPRNLLLLDNDFFGQPNWQARIEEIKAGDFKVSFNQGINARMITDEAAAAIGSIKYYDDQFQTRRIYTAWDNRKDQERLFAGLNALVKYGLKPDHIMVYMLVGYWPGETHSDREYRRAALREFGCRPYPMPFVRSQELVGFQRWVIGAYDKRISWSDWERARYEPRNLGVTGSEQLSLLG